ncbi:DUF7577 domain-containing protein [Haloarcula salinisoli]|uniref:DUF7577 domain-containing protein n=1 Tax=Haloarcula salinisoli TaxID=2487746 RepID=A0A8J8C974_9EURY|nr:hypothetical protein [Halomicroarcula salinisoli]MBX0286564.1 hypothetical protein [Halomicroarcula salinisoli]MBX0303914.1 hypothetical protein [Halomicroarcula salinisoli]
MVTVGELYLLTVTVMALVALAAAVPVLRDIAREGRKRLQQGGPEPPVEEAPDDIDGVRCRHCGAMNDNGYTYCEECSQQL